MTSYLSYFAGTEKFSCSLTNPVVKEKGEAKAKATNGSVDFSFSLTIFHGVC